MSLSIAIGILTVLIGLALVRQLERFRKKLFPKPWLFQLAVIGEVIMLAFSYWLWFVVPTASIFIYALMLSELIFMSNFSSASSPPGPDMDLPK